MHGGFLGVGLGVFCLGGIEFRFKIIFKSRVQPSIAAEPGGRVPGEQERAASTRGKCPAAETPVLEEHPSRRDGQGVPRCC